MDSQQMWGTLQLAQTTKSLWRQSNATCPSLLPYAHPSWPKRQQPCQMAGVWLTHDRELRTCDMTKDKAHVSSWHFNHSRDGGRITRPRRKDKGVQAVNPSCPHHCLLLHTSSRFLGKKGNGANHSLNIFFWWTRSSWMELRFPTSCSSFTAIQNTNRTPSPPLRLLLLLFTAPRTKSEWRQNYSLKVNRGYFPSRVRCVGNDTLTQCIGGFCLWRCQLVKRHSLNTLSDHLFSLIFKDSSQTTWKCRE